jgi:Acyl-CoA carboxylase epsilon subunit
VTNDQAPVSDETPVIDENAAPDADQPHAPHIQVLKGSPTDADVAALVAVLGSAVGGGEPPKPVFSQWGMPVDKLRYSIHSWQRMSLQQRTHMRGK